MRRRAANPWSEISFLVAVLLSALAFTAAALIPIVLPAPLAAPLMLRARLLAGFPLILLAGALVTMLIAHGVLPHSVVPACNRPAFGADRS
jgi:hypothetical protein